MPKRQEGVKMVDTVSTEAARKRWEGAIGRVPAAYADGVNQAKDVIAKGVAAESLYQQKLQESMADNRRARKLAEVSDEQWRTAAREKGAARIGSGMNAAKDKFGAGIGRVLDTIRGTSIGPRTADPLANVDNRVKPIVKALADMKR